MCPFEKIGIGVGYKDWHLYMLLSIFILNVNFSFHDAYILN